MNLNVKLIPADTLPLLRSLRKLYVASFPDDELKPFGMLTGSLAKGQVEMLAAMLGGEFAGLAVTATDGELVLLDYLAVEPELRGSGVGAGILAELSKMHTGRPILIEIESVKVAAPDLEIRKRRRGFYLRNGFEPLGVGVNLFGVEMELLALGGGASYDGYRAMLRRVWGDGFVTNVNLTE